MINKQKFYTKSGELNLFSIMALLTIIPTVIAAIYYMLFAANLYVSQTQFTIYSSEPAQQAIPGLEGISQVMGNSVGISNNKLEQLLIVSEYIKSFDMLKKLDEQLNLKKIYSEQADFYSALSSSPTNEEFLKHYNSMIQLKVNRDALIIDLKTKAYNGEDALKIGTAINKLSEEFINKMLERVKQNSLKASK